MPSVHPRRRPARLDDHTATPSLIDSFQKMNLRKGETFANNNKTQDIWDPVEALYELKAARASTCPKSLEDLLLGAGERRTVDLLQRVDKAIATNSKLALGAVLREPEVLPLPTFVVASARDDTFIEKVRPDYRRHSHSSDSGIGSSVADSDCISLKSTGERPGSSHHAARPVQTLTSNADDTSTPSSHSTIDEESGLSDHACRQIHKHIVKPILDEDTLKDFHPLVKQVPKRIGNKEITTLRELEKTLIFLAPVSGLGSLWDCADAYCRSGVQEYSRSPSKYLRFCQRTIRVLHTTVTTLHESDQRTPADRPYTQGYFFDLVEQIRRYAQILQATREKQEKGQNLDAMDYTPDETVSLHGGMTHNGKPAELVRHTKDGKTISVATGLPLSEEDLTMKRPLGADVVDDDDEEALRSMARRKKGAKPETHYCPVDACDKEFKRPCDLTKHIKTHERPWKCPDDKCKFHDQGWPTEKELERHINDKHSAEPPSYRCLFQPCPYNSKRESNCKQHMEKAHGWTYVRSKSNGKGNGSKTVTRLPRGSVPPSPSSTVLTPLTPIAPSPSVQSWASSRGSMPPPTGVPGPSNYHTPSFVAPSPDFAGHFNMNFNFNDMANFPTPALSDDRRASTSASSHSGLQLDGSSIDDGISPQDLQFDDFDFNSFNFPQASPYATAGASCFDNSMGGVPLGDHVSPDIARLDQTMTAPNHYEPMNLDDGFGGDFTLYGNAASTTADATAGAAMFAPLPAEGSSWGDFGGQFEYKSPSLMQGSSALDELFPELKGH
ncbi:hypothetical protein LTR62_005066 [Meristemomyces frigidus]|uniref:C2H2-type domain-containing protein n=1 Tax=Meristemomyces frigidus TaxID=1508187 RepID=A0AAN7THR2_9PEZI|nr:hypothetical protein LTR62_005066 [Meristemomyces frigidus]